MSPSVMPSGAAKLPLVLFISVEQAILVPCDIRERAVVPTQIEFDGSRASLAKPDAFSASWNTQPLGITKIIYSPSPFLASSFVDHNLRQLGVGP
jgi:hypothetical protein